MTKMFCVSLSMAFALLARAPDADRPAHAAEPAAPFEAASPNDAQTFTALMAESMVRMHTGMMVPETHQPDRDFAVMMIPHHQGAVDMALAELRFGHDKRLRRLAEGIIVEQRQEIEVMQRILADASR